MYLLSGKRILKLEDPAKKNRWTLTQRLPFTFYTCLHRLRVAASAEQGR